MWEGCWERTAGVLGGFILWLQLIPRERERKTIVISVIFSQMSEPVLPDPPLRSVLHLREEKVTCHRKCNKHVSEKTTTATLAAESEPPAISFKCEKYTER